MKIYLSKKPVAGPWGGGNRFVKSLSTRLSYLGHEVVYELKDETVDVIFCLDPRPNQDGLWYQNFLDFKNHFGSKILQRVGDVGTHGKPELTDLVKQSVKFSDFVIFPSSWAKDYIGFNSSNCETIQNKPLSCFYENRENNKSIKNNEKIRVVTHHWSTNKKKGFELYEKFSNLCEKSSKFCFTYIGRLPENYKLSGAFIIDPKQEKFLAEELPRHHIYLTASEEEAGANHVLEALAAGLPVAYKKTGGSIVEYCKEYGEQFSDFDSMLIALDLICENYQKFINKNNSFSGSIDDVIDRYCQLICNI